MVCRAVRELKADVEGRGMVSDRETSMGRRSSIISGSGGGTRGERIEDVRFCRRRIWWFRWVVRAECAVINLRRSLATSRVRLWREQVIALTSMHRPQRPLATLGLSVPQ